MNVADTLVGTGQTRFGLWPSVWKLLRLRARIIWNTFKRSKRGSKVGTVVLLVLLLAVMVGLFIGSSFLLRFMRSPELAELIDPAVFLNAIPTLVLTGAFFLTLMTNFGVLLQALYLSHDMDFLVTAPLPMRAVFLAKLLEAVLPNFALFCAFSLPVLFGLGTSSGYSFIYYPLLILLLVLLALAAGGLASILVMAVVRVVPARRVAEVLGVVGALLSFMCGQTGNLINAMDVDRSDVDSALNMLSSLDTPWSPLAWAGRGLTALGHGEWLTGLSLTLLTLVLAGVVFAGTLFLAEQLYYTGWASMQGSTRKKRPARSSQPAPVLETTANKPAPLLVRLIPAPVRGLIRKDFALLRRDPRNLSQLITPLILGFVMLFTTRGGGRRATAAMTELGLSNLEVYGLIALSLLVGWMLLFSLATLSFSREGKNYWMLKTAPLGPWHLLAGKFVVSFLPSAAFSVFYLLAAFAIRGLEWSHLPYALLVLLMSMAGATGIALAYGAAGANLEWDSPQRQRLNGAAGCMVFITVSLFMLFDVAFFLLPPGLWQIFTGSAPLIAYLSGGLLGTVAALIAVFLPMRLVVGRVARIGESG